MSYAYMPGIAAVISKISVPKTFKREGALMNCRALLAPALCAAVAAAPAAASPLGAVVVAKTAGNALLIWQATPFIAAIAAKQESDLQRIADVESAALQVIAERKTLLKRAASVSVKVMYIRTAAQNDPQYAPTSFAGFKQLLVLNVTKAALNRSSAWPKQLDNRGLPDGVTAVVTGKVER